MDIKHLWDVVGERCWVSRLARPFTCTGRSHRLIRALEASLHTPPQGYDAHTFGSLTQLDLILSLARVIDGPPSLSRIPTNTSVRVNHICQPEERHHTIEHINLLKQYRAADTCSGGSRLSPGAAASARSSVSSSASRQCPVAPSAPPPLEPAVADPALSAGPTAPPLNPAVTPLCSTQLFLLVLLRLVASNLWLQAVEI
ncbi:uncharacterized protein PSANT_06390 [Moesziomyces antarcticus]|uniref:Uncharacterized protein n=1 Tax=Pseudozyma antarctica TaxID=84753 RepID=A0A5C3FYV9_PSEA2|nr:uncharacterized protein PSANT_06390 [Moesziomyces antarcticus]